MIISEPLQFDECPWIQKKDVSTKVISRINELLSLHKGIGSGNSTLFVEEPPKVPKKKIIIKFLER